jgi:hypothetical protein
MLLQQQKAPGGVKAQTFLFQKGDQYTIENNSQDILNESSNVIYDEVGLTQSNKQMQILQNKGIMGGSGINYTSNRPKNDESYIDTNFLYEQFIQGPHIIPNYQTQSQEEVKHFQRPTSKNGQHPYPR